MYFPIEHLNMDESRIRTFFTEPSKSNMNCLPLKTSDRSPIQLPDFKSLNINECLERCSPTPSNYSIFDEQRNGRDTESIQVKVPTSEHVAEIVGKQGELYITTADSIINCVLSHCLPCCLIPTIQLTLLFALWVWSTPSNPSSRNINN